MNKAVLLGITVTIGATALAWLLNRASEEEEKRHVILERELRDLAQKWDSAKDEQGRSVNERKVSDQRGWIEKCRKELEDCRQKDRRIRPDLERVIGELKKQVAAPSVDSFRRRLLRRELMRFDDALLRLQAYPCYLDWYEKKFDSIIASSTIGDVLDLGVPEARLPEFWLYPGKLILLPTSFLGEPLPEFDHTVILEDSPSPALQKKYFYSRETSPILITAQGDKPGMFRRCALKGTFFHDYVIKNIPTDFKVVSTGREYCVGSMMEDTIRAILPRDKMTDPGMDKFKGQSLKVYLEESTILLNGNHSRAFEYKGKTLPILSELSPNLFLSDSLPLFLLLDSTAIADDACKAAGDTLHPFDLHDLKISEEATVLVLQKTGWLFYCRAIPDGLLRLDKVEEVTELESSGLSLPFFIVPAELKLANHLIPNPVGLARLIEHAGRLSNMEERAVAASNAVDFFNKWNTVLNFLQEREGERELLFHAEARKSKRGWELDLNARPEDVETFRKAYTQECSSQWTPSIFLQLQTEQGAWRTLCREGIQFEERGRLSFSCKQAPECRALYRLSFHTAQYAPLEKQSRALAALWEDRFFTSPYVREALLLPQKGFYKPKVSEEWREHLSKDSVWMTAPSELSRNQKDVIQGCLSTAPLVLVQGPPGTGKTRCILEMVYQFLSFNPKGRILISSQQNTAVDNVIDKLTICHGDFLKKNNIKILRIGTESKMSETARLHTFEALKQEFANILIQEVEEGTHLHGYLDSSSSMLQGLKKKTSPQSSETVVQEKVNCTKLYSDFAKYIIPILLAQNQDRELLYCLSRACQVVAGTCVGLAGKIQALENCRFDLVIIDEAGRALPSELLIPIQLAEKVVLIGDHYQLPPCVDPLLREEETLEEHPFLKETFLDESFFGILFGSLPENARFRLADQYRMDNAIGDLVADLFYTENGQRMLHNGAPNIKKRGGIFWCNVKGEHERSGTSLYNEKEIEEVAKLLSHLDERCSEGKLSSIAVITPYREQKKRLIQKKEEISFKHLAPENIDINTVDQFQGGEADAVIYSTVRTSGNMNFLLDKKRLNVACSRARHLLIFVGKKDYFSQEGNNLFADIISRYISKS